MWESEKCYTWCWEQWISYLDSFPLTKSKCMKETNFTLKFWRNTSQPPMFSQDNVRKRRVFVLFLYISLSQFPFLCLSTSKRPKPYCQCMNTQEITYSYNIKRHYILVFSFLFFNYNDISHLFSILIFTISANLVEKCITVNKLLRRRKLNYW